MSTQFNCQKTFLFKAIQLSQTVLIQTNQFSISIVFVYIQLNVKTVLFQTIQFRMSTQFNCQKTFLFKAIQFSQTVLIQTIQFSMSILFVYIQLNVKTSISNNSV